MLKAFIASKAFITRFGVIENILVRQAELTMETVVELNQLNDKELVRLAAKAVGIVGEIKDTADDAFWLFPFDGKGPWNPLAHDGDALWLAVTLGLNIIQQSTFAGPEPVAAACGFGYEDYQLTSTDYGTDKYAANRRAIVLAAAEIGKRLQ